MQLAKVVITSVLILSACAEGLPGGKSCVLKCIQNVTFSQIRYLGCYTKVACSAISSVSLSSDTNKIEVCIAIWITVKFGCPILGHTKIFFCF